jgi:hypothetical protein
MLGKGDWLPGRAEPLTHQTYEVRDSMGLENPFNARLEVQWRVHVEGREPYEFWETRSAPLWTMKGHRTGRRWFQPKLRGSQGLLREVGVPCRVHPKNPEKIDIDWSRAYDEHQPAWNRLDARAKAYTQRAEGPLGKLIAPIEYLGMRKVSAEEQAQIDREVAERIEREERLPPEVQAEVDENEWIAAQGKEAVRLHKEGRRTRATVKALTPPQPPSIVWTISLDVEGMGPVEHRQAMNEAWAAILPPGAETAVMVDPVDPSRMTLG